MYIKVVLSIILSAVIPFCSYAQNVSALAAEMVDNLKAHNSKSVIIPGDNGVLNVYFEKTGAQNVSVHSMELIYNGIRSTFQIGTNIAITQNGRLVFARNNDKVYVHTSRGCREDLKITLSNIEYIYQKEYVEVKYKDEEFKFQEAVYDKNKSSFQVYNNGRYIKTVKIKKQ